MIPQLAGIVKERGTVDTLHKDILSTVHRNQMRFETSTIGSSESAAETVERVLARMFHLQMEKERANEWIFFLAKVALVATLQLQVAAQLILCPGQVRDVDRLPG